LLYIQKGRAIHIGSPTLNKQIRHDNQPANLNAFSFFSLFPGAGTHCPQLILRWRWRFWLLFTAVVAMLIIATWLCSNSLQLPPARAPAIITIPFFPAGTPLFIVKHT
jgi:hypothetical protein